MAERITKQRRGFDEKKKYNVVPLCRFDRKFANRMWRYKEGTENRTKQKDRSVDNKSEQTAEEEQTQTPDDMTEIQETAQATKKPVQTPTARKKDNKSVKATDTPRPSDA